ncbi:MAG: RlmE family RNA methyltransferase [Rickettsiaceae bacterium]|nr:RlmE family RNA methyltransferase [Rickettsiaceae bacterium]
MSKTKGYRGKFIQLKTAKNRSSSSSRWLQRQLNDPYVSKAKLDGYQSRAAYKLIDINNKFNILVPGMNVIDLGASPGGWSQVAAKITKSDLLNAKNKVIAIDLLPMDKLAGVISYQMDFTKEDTKELIKEQLAGKADIVLSDMAANTTGHSSTDHLRILDLCEQASEFALEVLKPGGHFVAKIFRGGAEASLLNKLKQNFHKVKHFKPSSSRAESSEFYLVALNKK